MNAGELEAALADAGILPLTSPTLEAFATFHALLERWNARMNLTSLRDSREAVSRHIVESIFCAQHLPTNVATLLDFGSGAGFPGIPIALCRPEIQVTLSESQGKKAAFLREAVRTLGLKNSSVFDGRVEKMDSTQQFDAVTLRAVDRMDMAILAGAKRVSKGGVLICFGTLDDVREPLQGFCRELERAIPSSAKGILRLDRAE